MRKILLVLILFITALSVSLSQNVSGRLVTSAYSWERQDSIGSSSTHIRAFQTFQFDVGKSDFALHTYFNASNDFGSTVTDDPRVRFFNLYLEKKNIFNAADLRIGRIPIFSGMGVGVIDGASIKFRASGNDLVMSGYFGGITPTDQSLKLIDKISENNMFGFQVMSYYVPNTSISLSYMNRHRKPSSFTTFRPDTVFNLTTVVIDNESAADKYGSCDIYYSKEMMNAYGRLDYDFNNSRLYRGEVSLNYNTSRSFGVSVDYFHRAPRIAYNSIFSVFEQNSTDEISLNANYLLNNKYNIFAGYSYVNYSDDKSSRLSIGVNSSIGSISYSRNFGYIGAIDVVNVDFITPVLERKVLLMAGINYSSYNFQNDEVKSAVAIIAGSTWRPSSAISADIQGQLLINDVYKNDFRVNLKFSYWFFSKLGIF